MHFGGDAAKIVQRYARKGAFILQTTNGMRGLGIVVGSKSRGSNMKAIVQGCRNGEIPANLVTVVSPVAASPAVEWATSNSVPVRVVERHGPDYAERLVAATEDCSLICLAGYMWLLPEAVLDAHPGAVLNIHPALLPRHGGKGMYGRHVHQAVLDAGERESGCTVHWVTGAYDEGAIIVQKRCPVYETDTVESLAARVLELEHVAYPEAIRRVLEHHGV